MTLDDLPDAPDPAVDPPSTFSIKAAAMVLALKNMIVQLRAFLAAVGILVSGSANKIPYRVDLGTAMTDPTAGWLRLNNATQNAATAMVLDVIGSDNIDYTSLLGTFAASTNPVLGTLRIEKQGDATKFLVFALTAVTTPAGYRQLTATCVQSSAANPFVQGDMVTLSFSRSGDKGVAGSMTQVIWVREEASNGTGGGTSGGSQTRTLNTVKVNTIAGAGLAGNIVTLPAGGYRLSAVAPAYGVGGHRAGAQYTSGGSTFQIDGSSAYSSTGNSSVSIINKVEFTIATGGGTVKINHPVTTSGVVNGLGYPASVGGLEVYTDVFIEKVS
jgi:hypothetical protein